MGMSLDDYNKLSPEDKKKVKFADQPTFLKVFTIGLLVGFVFLIGTCFGGGDDDKASSTASDKTTTNAPVETAPVKTLKERLETEVAAFEKKPFDGSIYRTELSSMQIELALFLLWGDMILQGENSSNPDEQKLAEKLKKQVLAVQKKELPILRKEYGTFAKNTLWEEDIDVYVSGTGNTTINFSGGLFAANKNIKEFQESMSKVLNEFRYKQVRYRWYKGASEYTYYDLSNSDSDILRY